jgi:hypothetical protein
MNRYRKGRLCLAAVGSVAFSVTMVVTEYGLWQTAVEDRRPIPWFVFALPITAAVVVAVTFVLVAWFELPSEWTPWRARLRANRPIPPRDELFARAYRMGRRVGAVGRNCLEAAHIRRRASQRLVGRERTTDHAAS